MKKKISSILGTLLLAFMVLGTNVHAEYNDNNIDRVNNNDITTRVNDNNMNRVNNDIRTRNVNTTNDLNNARDNDNNNWAWLGLLGLAGLFGLRRREKETR
ncbi:WGxxGxxG family protein [Bacillus bingmayongensis]|uniref:WGxxGxxG family protein n=1 Tax=Bacillus bingmayongensis TaxID=1150157 RepID=UPI0002D78A2D|nr:WGxxGxxG family protein [Bacillus bingmayongensis]MBY0599023.1 WGxxGxxG-CTERM domain-containing protein [Bacillus bingmayongensis]